MKKYLLLFILSLSIFTTLKVPVTIFQKYLPDFKLNGKVVDGSIYNEKIGKINFKLNSKMLLDGQLAFNLKLKNGINNINALIGINLFGNIVVTSASGKINLAYLRQLKPKLLKKLNIATAKITINNLDAMIDNFDNFIPKKLNSNFNINKINLLGEKIGNYTVAIKFKDQERFAIINNKKNSSFKVRAKIKLTNKEIRIIGDIAGKDKTAQDLLTNFGIKNKLNYKFKI